MGVNTFTGKVGVITGAGSGIGAAMAHRFGRDGMRLVLADIDADALDGVAEVLRSHGTEVETVVADVAQRADVQAIADRALERFGAVHLACNNAGIATGGLSWEVPDADWEWVLAVDLWSVIYGTSIFIPLIESCGGGHVVNTASMAGLTSPPFMAPYNVAKHGVVALSESTFHELAMTGSSVGISLLCPGWVKTRIHESDRFRPGADAAEPSRTAQDGPGSVIAGLVESGIAPEAVADLVADAVSANRFYVLTHPDWNDMVRTNTEIMLNGDNPRFSF